MVLSRSDAKVRNLLLSVLERGGVAIVPCDTIYGIVGRAPETEARIRSIKGRGETSPFLMLIGSVSQATALSEISLEGSVTALWPGPITLVLRAPGRTVAVRFPDDPLLTDVARTLGTPLFSTSVNRSGDTPLWQISKIVHEFEGEVDLVVDGGDMPGGRPSTILDVSRRPYRVLRQGEFQVPLSLLAGG